MFFDTHVHYNDNRYKEDREETIKHAYTSGVTNMVNVSYSIPSIAASIKLAERFDYIYAAVGIHPHNAAQMNDQILNDIKNAAQHKKVAAIGEIGLDYFRNFSPKEVQKICFAKQIHLARELKLPIIIHNRDAHQDVLNTVISENAKEVGGIIHSYAGNVEFAKKFLDQNFYISISGPITYKNPGELIQVVRMVPNDRLLIETDCPYLTPEPFRGKRNHSGFVKLVAEKIAEIKKTDVEDIAYITTQNAKKVFNIL